VRNVVGDWGGLLMAGTNDTMPVWAQARCDKNLSAIEYRVLAYLLWRQGDNGHAWPAQITIADDLGLTVQTIRNITRRLAAKGWLSIERPNISGRGHSCHYSLAAGRVNGGLPFEGKKGSTAIYIKGQRPFALTQVIEHNPLRKFSFLRILTRCGCRICCSI
jgi:hypothetical protein